MRATPSRRIRSPSMPPPGVSSASSVTAGAVPVYRASDAGILLCMSTYQVEPDELRASASDLRTAASSARGADAADAISALGGALPGSSTESVMPEFATAWDEGIDAWASTRSTASPTGSTRRPRTPRRPTPAAQALPGVAEEVPRRRLMSITYGDLRSWRAAGVTSASEMLRADIKELEKARDTVETDAVPAAFDGLARMAAVARQAALVATMEAHIEGLTSFERKVYAQAATVTSIEKAVQDIDTDAAAQQFSIDSSGTVSDVAPRADLRQPLRGEGAPGEPLPAAQRPRHPDERRPRRRLCRRLRDHRRPARTARSATTVPTTSSIPRWSASGPR